MSPGISDAFISSTRFVDLRLLGWPPSARATEMLRLAVVQIPASSGEDCLVYDGGFPSLKAASRQRGNPGPNPGGRTNNPRPRRQRWNDGRNLIGILHVTRKGDESP